MTRIRHVSIKNFRSIRDLSWFPGPGLNCLIGPGDGGKSTLLDAIDLCLSGRRTATFTDADFHGLDVSQPIAIEITVGALPDRLKSMETYGNYLRNFDAAALRIDDEPEAGGETVLTLSLTVTADLEPNWTLISDRAPTDTQKLLSWSDRNLIAPTRLGSNGGQHLGWRRGSVLNKLSEEKADTSAALASAARLARLTFGDHAEKQLAATLTKVADAARSLGVPAGDNLRALLDAHSVSVGTGTVTLHDKAGIPLDAMGTGSTRLLSVGLQRAAAESASIVIVDELEYGLEPHRIMRLLGSLGAKETPPPMQGFLTTHSPVAVRELSSAQLHVMRHRDGKHVPVTLSAEAQGTARSFPEAFLATAIVICEGASEVGFLRGLDRFAAGTAKGSLFAAGLALIDAGGCDKIYSRALPMAGLGYRAAVFRDDDKQPDAGQEKAFTELGGTVFKWRTGKALEQEIFENLSDRAVLQLLERAVALHGEEYIADQLSSASGGEIKIEDCRAGQGTAVRDLLAGRAKSKAAWFKNVGYFEDITYDILLPDAPNWKPEFKAVVNDMAKWVRHGG